MLLRGKSKERKTRKVTPPGPVYMSNDQFADYLADLRNNRVARPAGARPQPASMSSRRDSGRISAMSMKTTAEPEPRTSQDFPSRSASALSFNRTGAQSAMSTYSSVNSRVGRPLVTQPVSNKKPTTPLKPSDVVPSATYIERGQRWMEREDATALRNAIEDMDQKEEDKEEIQLYSAAHDEASELVWQHQHPNEPKPDPDAPYRYKGHLRKNSYAHARTQSVGRYSGLGMATGLDKDYAPRSVSGSSSGSGGSQPSRSRVVSGESYRSASSDTARRVSHDSTRRRSMGKRNISGEIATPFSSDQIWEEPGPESMKSERPNEEDVPAPLRIKPRNPLNRVQFAPASVPSAGNAPLEVSKRLLTSEIHRNPPSQSRNPSYTSNPPPPTDIATNTESIKQDGQAAGDTLEIRGDDIRQATSMRLKDRSPKLPTPSAVSNRPGRPIVSFDASWEPNKADKKQEAPKRFDIRSHDSTRQSLPTRPNPKADPTPIPTICVLDAPAIRVNNAPSIPTISVQKPPSIPVINVHESPSIPVINVQETPSIPTISVPSIVVPNDSKGSTPDILVISPPTTGTGRARPLPDPKAASSRPKHNSPFASRGHWSPAAGKRATATCHQCQLPIEGRVVALRGVAQRFHPECFICFTCGTGLEALEISPEPESFRQSRLDRIRRRAEGEIMPENEGQTMAEDGDSRLRFFCHLDWHEQFAPKCKHCKTPIIGEHVVALGEHWHYGHFFCAECGDPFEQGMTHIEKDGYAWCLRCQTKRTENRAPKCRGCKLPVIGTYVEALGGEYHEQCFRCADCNGGFEDGQIFPRDVEGGIIVLCTACMEIELKA